MIIFICGEDSYRSHQRLVQLRQKFKEKFGDINITEHDINKDEAASGQKILALVNSMPFLSEKRLIIIKDLLLSGEKETKEQISQGIENIAPTSIVVFYENNEPKKNQKIYRRLLKFAKVERYNKFSQAGLIRWVEDEARRYQAKISMAATHRLIYFCGNDLFRLEQEVIKLADYCHPRLIDVIDVEALVKPKIEARIFDLLDLLALRNIKPATETLHKLLTTGEKEIYIISMINYGFRNLVLIKFLLQQDPGMLPRDIAKKLSLHPFVVSKALSSTKYFSFSELKAVYKKLLAANIAMRRKNNNNFLILDLLVADICQR